MGNPVGNGTVLTGSDRTLKGLRVLVVEDELLVALTLTEMLETIGCVPVATAGTVAEALAAVEAHPDIGVALLDINLGFEQVFPVADVLAERGVPFLFSTGYAPADLSSRYPGRGLLRKPYRLEVLAQALRQA